MDRNFTKSPHSNFPIDDIGELKYVSGLSTILVATIQEAKDRISQMEYIFCRQLFPNFQSKCKNLQKIYSDAREAAEDEWKNKESDLMLQIERLRLENKGILEENQSLRLENSNSSFDANSEKKLKELEEKYKMLLQKNRNLDLEAQEIRGEFMKKSKEVDEHEEKKSKFIFQIKCLENNVGMVQEQLREKNNEVVKEKALQEKLIKENNSYISKNLNNEQLLDKYKKEKKLLTDKIECLERSVNELQRKTKNKNAEVEESRKLQEQYLEQIDINSKEILKLEKENMSLVAKQKDLQDKINKFDVFLRERANETSEGLELHGKLLQQIEEKDSELQSERKKRRDLIALHKNLKSQYNFLLAKFGLTTLTTESLSSPDEIKSKRNPSKAGQFPITSPDNGMKAPIQGSSSELQSPISPAALMEPINTKSGLLSGQKRPLSSWRDTRSNQGQGGFDPHDNFLDTPLENIKENIKKSLKDGEIHDIPDRAPRDIKFDGSDGEETQDLGGDSASKKPAPGPENKSGFKYNGPVRKRSERENLKGIECKQCRKFYDAVLPDGGDNNKNLRCEHHDGVSRHRYRFAPPSTPEGFWNIGFESEM